MSPLIWIPTKRDLIVPTELPRTRIAGFYKLEARKADGRMRPLTGWFPNLITNGGLDMLGIATNFLGVCAVGSGNTAPSFTDTALQSLIASTSTTNFQVPGAQSSSPYYGSLTTQYAFAIGAAAGNLSEVGVGTGATSLFSRALILDGGGSPTTITVLSSEALYVTYQFNQYVPLSDVTGTIVISGTSYGYTLRARNATNTSWAAQVSDSPGIYFPNGSAAPVFNGTLGTITSSGPSGASAQASSVANNAYSAGSYTLSGTVTYGLTAGNVTGGVTAASFQFGTTSGSRGLYQIGFGTAIPKDGSHVLTLSYSNSWARM